MRRRGSGGRRTVCCVTVGIFLLPSTVGAGSVFMKNGYILQGPVAEKTSDRIVLEWPNGKVTIPRRFVANVVLDPKEKQQLEARRKARAKKAPMPAEEEVLEVNISLPPNPEEFLPGRRTVKRPPQGVQPRTTVPAISMGGRRELAPGLMGSLPQGWSLHGDADSFLAEGPAIGQTHMRARVAAVRVQTPLPEDRQLELARRELKKAFSQWVLLEEGWRELGLRRAYEISGRGNRDGAQVRVRHVVVWVGGYAWLVTAVMPQDPQASRAVEWCLQSLEFQDR